MHQAPLRSSEDGWEQALLRLREENERLRTCLADVERRASQALMRATRLAQVVSLLGRSDPCGGAPLELAATDIASLFSADICVVLVGPDDDLAIASRWGLAAHASPERPVPLGDELRAALSRDAVLVSMGDMLLPSWLAGYGLAHVAWTRLVGSREVGVIVVGRRADEPFSRADEAELRAVAYRIATAVENEQLRQARETQLRRLRRLHELTVELSAAIDPEAVARCLARAASDGLRASACGVYIARGALLELVDARVSAAGRIPQQLPVREAAASLAADVALLELRDGDQLLGAVALSPAPEPGSELDLVVRNAADIGALALRRALLWERTKEQARLDSLTGLPAHRAFHERLEELLAHGSAPLSLALLDIDDFKQINDRYGHPVGDDALRAVADTLRSGTRGDDEAFRIGGEEFAVVMPATEAASALRAATRLCERVRAIAAPVTLTISVGVAEAGVHGTTRDELIAAADAALYKAKRAGKDRAVLADPPASDAGARGATRSGLRGASERHRLAVIEGGASDKTAGGSDEHRAAGDRDEAEAPAIPSRRPHPPADRLRLAQAQGSERTAEGALGPQLAALVAALYRRDPASETHTRLTLRLVREIARQAELDAHTTLLAERAARVQALGKLAWPPEMLRSQRPLDRSGYELVRVHTLAGEALLRGLGAIELARIVRSHHERFDGCGYPDGLHADSIPLAARLLHLAEAIAAMSLDRPYRRALTPAQVAEELAREGGGQFDPDLVDAALSIPGAPFANLSS